MTPFVRLLAIVFFFAFFWILIRLLKQRSIRPFYCTIWFLISMLMLSVVVFESFYKSLATRLGLEDATFLVIGGVIWFLLMYVLYLTVKVSATADRVQELISYTAILERDVRQLKRTQGP